MTGVAVITTLDADGAPAGVTANSFSSVSLEPPLVCFSLGKVSDVLAAFEDSSGFVVHVLAADQQELSVRFATKGIERFAGLDWEPGHAGLPVIGGALAVFQCDLAHAYDGGDHTIFVGEVRRLDVGDTEMAALGFFRGRYVSSASP